MAEEMFKTTLMGGFDKDEVVAEVNRMREQQFEEKTRYRADLDEKDKQIEDLMTSLAAKEQEIAALRNDIKEKYQTYIDNYETIGRLIYETKVNSEKLLAETQEERERILASADEEKTRILADADAEAKRRLAAADEEAAQKLDEGKKQYAAVQEELGAVVDVFNNAQKKFMQSFKAVHAIADAMSVKSYDADEDLED